MKKIMMGILFSLFAMNVQAHSIYCPTNIACTNHGSTVTCSTNLGGGFVAVDGIIADSVPTGTYPLNRVLAANNGNPASCAYKVWDAPEQKWANIWLNSTEPAHPDMSQPGSKWMLAGNDCYSSNPRECPLISYATDS